MTDKKKIDYKKILKSCKKNYWAISTITLAILLTVVLINGATCGSAIGTTEAGQKVLDFANNQGAEAELLSSTDNGQLYEVILSIQGQEVPVYVTKDGENLIPSLIPLTADVVRDTPQQQPTQTETTKSDKPVAELFIMTHCPYGTQAEKGFLPVLESFDKADAQIRFVHYFMHEPEETETPIQVCIREEQSDKFLPYLREFLKEGISEDALAVANVDVAKMNECVSSGKWEEYYNVDKALSESYGVRGSPTLVINGVIAQSGRDATSYLSAICSAFNNAPEECNTLTLSNTAPSPMWGWDESGSDSQAQC
ncbi:thioredoxin domain-containing protein [Candidatus Pacearchaeota archaeon]|nr:thioredoxin domain-containing protein [Candidatus Pacearchaeota archaeon]